MNSAAPRIPLPSDRDTTAQKPEDNCCATRLSLSRLQDLLPYPSFLRPSYPPISSIPRTSADRLSAPDASPSVFPDEPIPAASLPSTYTPPGKPPSVLYLAYGSNLCAQTFLGQRGIRPLSQVNVSCPSLDLTFDLPGLPYVEPCFANTAPRKVPRTPPKFPPGIPDLPGDPTKPPPDLPDVPDPRKPSLPPPPKWSNEQQDEENKTQPRKDHEPVWDKGLIGVVYEVTQSDYIKIVATEGGGTGYNDIVVPCLPLPASVGVPERPPEIPIPFLAHTLFAPRLPDIPDKDEDALDRTPTSTTPSDDDDDKPSPPNLPNIINRLPPWARSLFLPTNRRKSHPFEPYAQPSERYLSLITTGAYEHDLPASYQTYLSALQPYTITTRSQQIAQYIFKALTFPIVFIIIIVGQKLFVDPMTGKLPLWFGLVMNFFMNLFWLGYDYLAKPIFGDGERTEEEEDESIQVKKEAVGWGSDEEKQSLLLRDW